MQLGVGGSINFMIEQKGSLQEIEAKIYMCQLIFAIEYLHDLDIIMRDLKLENIVLDQNSNILLIDFGHAYQLGPDDDKLYDFVGTYPYMPPELIQNQGYNKSYDIYSLGIIFYELVTGVHPFMAESKEQIRSNILKADVKQKNISSVCYNLIMKMIDKNPTKRPDIKQIKKDRYFSSVDWQNVNKMKTSINSRFEYTKISYNIDQAILIINNFQKYHQNYTPYWDYQYEPDNYHQTSIQIYEQIHIDTQIIQNKLKKLKQQIATQFSQDSKEYSKTTNQVSDVRDCKLESLSTFQMMKSLKSLKSLQNAANLDQDQLQICYEIKQEIEQKIEQEKEQKDSIDSIDEGKTMIQQYIHQVRSLNYKLMGQYK